MAEPKDVSKKHFYISIVKSLIRASSGWALLIGNIALAGFLLIVAEVFGIAEEL
tara:strand:+ start:380 stop:541 length:162 start_codon:yes stop_codon:yes gene_type:complete